MTFQASPFRVSLSTYNEATGGYEFIEDATGGPGKVNFSLLVRNAVLRPGTTYFVQFVAHWDPVAIEHPEYREVLVSVYSKRFVSMHEL